MTLRSLHRPQGVGVGTRGRSSAPGSVAQRDIAELPCDPDDIQLSYALEASLGNHADEGTLEKWRVTAHLGEDFGMDDIPPCDACTAKWRAAYDADGYVDEEERCPHRLLVGEFELVKVRWDGSLPLPTRMQRGNRVPPEPASPGHRSVGVQGALRPGDMEPLMLAPAVRARF